MPSIQLTKDNVDRAQQFILQYMRDSGYEGSLEDGTGIYDVLVKGFSVLFAMFQQQADKTEGYISLAKAQEYKDLLGDEYDLAVDAILSNWFVSRKDGVPTSGRLRLWFTRPSDFLHLNPPDVLFSFNETKFTVKREYIFTIDDFSLVANKPQNAEEYYVDVEVVSSQNIETFVAEGATLYSYLNNIYFIRAEAINSFEPGKEKETSDDFIERSRQAVTTRELITDNAIQTVLTEEFEFVSGVYTAGYGSDEQIRDVVSFEDMSLHIGNKADIYLRTPFRKTSVPCTVGPGGLIDLVAVTGAETHIAHVMGIETIPQTEDEVIWEPSFTVSVDEKTWLTKTPQCDITVTGVTEGAQVNVTYLYSADVFPVTDFVTSDLQRVACYDPFIKSMHPILLYFDLQVTFKDATLEDMASVVREEVHKYVLDLNYKQPYTESTLIEHLHRNISELEAINVPIQASYTLFDEEASVFQSNVCSSNFLIPDIPMSNQITANTAQFYTDTDLVQVSLIAENDPMPAE